MEKWDPRVSLTQAVKLRKVTHFFLAGIEDLQCARPRIQCLIYINLSHCYSHSVGQLFIWFYGYENPGSKGLNNLLKITQLFNGGSSIQTWKPDLIVSINRSINSPTSVNICSVFPLVTVDKFSWLYLKPSLLFWILPFLPYS